MNSDHETSSNQPLGYRHGLFEFLPDSLGLHIDGSPEQYPFLSSEPWESNLAASREARYMHEEDHFLRTIGTSAGLMAHCLNGRILDSYVTMLGTCDLSQFLQGQTLTQALRWAVRLPAQAGHPAPALHILAADLDVRNALLGFPVSSPMSVVQRSAIRHWGRTLEYNEAKHEAFYCPPNATYPYIPLTTVSLFEALGIIKESLYSADDNLLLQPSAEYIFAIAYGRAQLEELFDWDVQPVELEAALALALWPPLTPDGLWPRSQDQGRYHWEDIEPGHRYCRIVEHLRSRNQRLTNHNTLSQSEREAFFIDFSERMCRELAWATPYELAHAWIKHLYVANPWERASSGWWNVGARSFRTQGAYQFLTWYLSHPYIAFYQDETCRGTSPRLRFSYVSYLEHLQIQERNTDKDGKTLSALLEATMFLGMKYVLYSRNTTAFQQDRIDRHLDLLPALAPQVENRSLFDANVLLLRHLLLE